MEASREIVARYHPDSRSRANIHLAEPAAEHRVFSDFRLRAIYIHFHGVDDLLVGTMLGQPGALLGWSVVRKPHRYTSTVRCKRNAGYAVTCEL